MNQFKCFKNDVKFHLLLSFIILTYQIDSLTIQFNKVYYKAKSDPLMQQMRFYTQNITPDYESYQNNAMQDKNQIIRKSLDRQHRKYLQDQIQINKIKAENTRVNSRLMDINYQKKAIQNFPFGKQRVKIANYVSKQMDAKEQEDNRKILQKFRLDAINFRNNKYNRHRKIGSEYVTQNMLPGISNNPSLIADLKNQRQRNQPHLMFNGPNNNDQQIYRWRNPNTVGFRNFTQPIQMNYQMSRNLQNNYSLNPQKQYIQHNSQTQTPIFSLSRRKKKSKNETKNYFSRNSKSDKQVLNKIQVILKEINKKIKMNSQILQDQIKKSQQKCHKMQKKQYLQSKKCQYAQQIQKRQKWNLQVFLQTRSSSYSKRKSKPTVQMTNKSKFDKPEVQSNYLKTLSQQHKDKNDDFGFQIDRSKKGQLGITKIRQHLKLLKKNNHRLDYLNTIQL